MYYKMLSHTRFLLRGQNCTEKIASRHSIDKGTYYTGDFIEFIPKYLMTHDNTSAVLDKFENANLNTVHNADQLKFIMDHDIQNKSVTNLAKYERIKKFAKEQKISYFAPGHGIGHQVMCEEGFVTPGNMIVASDSHSNMYGALGALGTPVVRTDAAYIWKTGKTWWQIPPVVLVEFKGKLRPGVYAKDVILSLINKYPTEVLNCAVEFKGYSNFSIEERMTIANMTTEWGAVSGIFPADHKTIDWIMDISRYSNLVYHEYYDIWAEYCEIMMFNDLHKWAWDYDADKDAEYHAKIILDLSTVTPTITGPDDVGTKAYRTDNIIKIPIDKGFLLSCVNARYDDLKIASNLLAGRKLNAELYVAASSKNIEEDAKSCSIWSVFEKAGAKFLPPGCGPCIGMGKGILKDGEVAISATNRNYKGRMGSRNAKCYLASPATVVKACIDGYISLPEKSNLITNIVWYKKNKIDANTYINTMDNIAGHIVVLDKDNISTDLIYAGKHTYRDLDLNEQAKVVLENYGYNEKFPDKFIIVTGSNFGTGSSREQAVTALQARGCVAIIASSFNSTYLRNAFNNGLPCFTMEKVLDNIPNYCGNEAIIIPSKGSIEIGKVNINGIQPISLVGQKLLSNGGIKLEEAN